MGKDQRLIFGAVRCFHQYSKIQQALIQFLRDLLCVAAGDMVMQFRVLLLKFLNGPCQQSDLIGFSQAQIDIPAGDVVQRDKFLGNLIRHADQILRAVAQQDAFVCQTDAEAVARKQLLAQLILQRLRGFESVGWVTCSCSAALVMFSSLATARKYRRVLISILSSMKC